MFGMARIGSPFRCAAVCIYNARVILFMTGYDYFSHQLNSFILFTHSTHSLGKCLRVIVCTVYACNSKSFFFHFSVIYFSCYFNSTHEEFIICYAIFCPFCNLQNNSHDGCATLYIPAVQTKNIIRC